MRVRAGEIVVTRTGSNQRAVANEREVPLNDDGLRVERNRGADVEMIAGQHHQIERRRSVHNPVELGQRVVEVGD